MGHRPACVQQLDWIGVYKGVGGCGRVQRHTYDKLCIGSAATAASQAGYVTLEDAAALHGHQVIDAHALLSAADILVNNYAELVCR